MTRPPLLLLLALAACKAPAEEGQSPGDCRDGADNDADSRFDCDDPGCAGSPDCEEADADADADTDADADADADTDADTDADADTDSDADADPCDYVIEETWPAPEATTFYYRDTVSFTLSQRDPGHPEVTLVARSTGDAVPGASSVSSDGETVSFTPTDPLEPSTAYLATLHWCRGETDLPFSTSSLGEDLRVSVTDRTYSFDLSEGRIVYPEASAAILETYFTTAVLAQVLTATSSSITFRMASSVEDDDEEQDLCVATLDTPAADFTASPYVEMGPSDWDIPYEDGTLVIYDAVFSGTFSSDGSLIGGGTFAGQVDARDMVGLVPDVGSPDEFCDISASVAAPCTPCRDGEPYCLECRAVDLQGNYVRGLTLDELVAGEWSRDCGDEIAGCGGCAVPGSRSVPALTALALALGALLRRRRA